MSAGTLHNPKAAVIRAEAGTAATGEDQRRRANLLLSYWHQLEYGRSGPAGSIWTPA